VLTPLGENDPQQIGPYRIQGLLGRGGMGAVYLGFSPDNKAVAVKVPASTLARDAQFRARFRREVDAARRVRGRSVAAVLDADAEGARPWMATEYVEGKSLAEAVAERGHLDDRLAATLALGLAEALVAIHAAGVVHRDLKPANVVLSWDGPRVIDFGVASAEGATSHTSTGMLIGTVVWMAPEQLRGERAGPAADIFAWGACVAFAASGQPPFRAATPEAVGVKILSQPPDLTGVPAALLPTVRAALEKDLARRPTAAQLRDRLLRGGAMDDVITATTDGGATQLAGGDAYETALARVWEMPGGSTPRPDGSSPGRPGPAGPRPAGRPPAPTRVGGPRTPVPTAVHPGAGRGGYGDPAYRDTAFQEPGRYPSATTPGRQAAPTRRRRGLVTALIAVLAVAVLGGGVAAALTLAHPGGTPGAAGRTPGTATAGLSTTATQPTTSATPSATPQPLTAADVEATIEHQGYTPIMDTFDPTRPLNVVIGTKSVPAAAGAHTATASPGAGTASATASSGRSSNATTTAELAFVFSRTRWLGTDTRLPSREITLISLVKDTVVLRYALFAATDGDCCPSGSTDLTFRYDAATGKFTTTDSFPPTDPTVDNSRR
jgi:predicted Ser/Thr protein kinase